MISKLSRLSNSVVPVWRLPVITLSFHLTHLPPCCSRSLGRRPASPQPLLPAGTATVDGEAAAQLQGALLGDGSGGGGIEGSDEAEEVMAVEWEREVWRLLQVYARCQAAWLLRNYRRNLPWA